MGRRNSLTNLINLQRFRHHSSSSGSGSSSSSHTNSHDHEESLVSKEEPAKQTNCRHVRTPSSSSLEDDESSSSLSILSNKMMRRHSTGGMMASSSSNPAKAVRFGDCQIRSYPQVLGDHPYCSMGCPVELGWVYTEEETRKVNDFEEQRFGSRRSREQLVLSPEERRSILTLNENGDVRVLRKACRRQCTRKAQRKIQREFFSS